MTRPMYKVRHLPSSSLVVTDLEILSTGAEKRRGLLGRDHLPEGAGLLFPGVWSIHTVGMAFPIDVIFTDKNLYVRRVVTDLPPTRMVSAFMASYCLEMPAGTLARLGLNVEPGDGLRIEKHVEKDVEKSGEEPPEEQAEEQAEMDGEGPDESVETDAETTDTTGA